MIEKRKYHRVLLSSRTELSQRNGFHLGQLVNISMNGALLRLEFGTYVPKGSEYDLTVYIEGEDIPLQFKTEVVSTTFAMAGVKFVSYVDDTETRLEDLLGNFLETTASKPIDINYPPPADVKKILIEGDRD